MKFPKLSGAGIYKSVRKSTWFLALGYFSGFYVLMVWLLTMGHNETADPSSIVLMISVVIAGLSAYSRRITGDETLAIDELFPTRAGARFVSLGAQCGALLLPKFLFPRMVFPSHAEVTITFLQFIPGIWAYLLTLSCLTGAALGVWGVWFILDFFGKDSLNALSANDVVRSIKPINIFSEQLFNYILFIPLLYLFSIYENFGEFDIISRIDFIPDESWIFFVLLESLTISGVSFYVIYGNELGERTTKLVYFFSLGAAVLGANLMWHQCGSFRILQKINDHKLALTPWTERILFFEWTFEGLVGACGLSCLVGFLAAKVSNFFQS